MSEERLYDLVSAQLEEEFDAAGYDGETATLAALERIKATVNVWLLQRSAASSVSAEPATEARTMAEVLRERGMFEDVPAEPVTEEKRVAEARRFRTRTDNWTGGAASSVSAGAVKALIADASEPFLVPDVTPRGASKAAVFHVLRDMVDAGALEHHVDGYRRPNAAASSGAGQVPADTALTRCSWNFIHTMRANGYPDVARHIARLADEVNRLAEQVPADTIEKALRDVVSVLYLGAETDGLSRIVCRDKADRAAAALAAVRTPEEQT